MVLWLYGKVDSNINKGGKIYFKILCKSQLQNCIKIIFQLQKQLVFNDGSLLVLIITGVKSTPKLKNSIMESFFMSSNFLLFFITFSVSSLNRSFPAILNERTSLDERCTRTFSIIISLGKFSRDLMFMLRISTKNQSGEKFSPNLQLTHFYAF